MKKLESQNDELRAKIERKKTEISKRPIAIVKPTKYNPFKKVKKAEKLLFPV